MTMHLDPYGRPHEKFIRFVGSKGTLLWSADPNQIRDQSHRNARLADANVQLRTQ